MPDGIQVQPSPSKTPGPPAETGAAPPGRSRSRRHLLRALLTLGTVAGTAAALTPLWRAGHPAAGGGEHAVAPGPGSGEGGVLEELYRGRHIRVAHARTAAVSERFPSPAPPEIRIDGRPLHVMRRADGSYLSAVNHYESFPTPLEAARAAVDALDGAQLAPAGPVHHI
ncbi:MULTISPECIES: tyrosinase family oxidase copper chaperone [unclassified Streptomyces]|uniref:tyrosinase family oxidase copper chaperone n=1 Tax=unclassified Streptomyces TaxID=2593676 RepID=UPI00382AAE4C